MTPTPEFQMEGVLVIALLGVVLTVGIVFFMGELFGPAMPAAFRNLRGLAALILLLAIPFWGAGIGVFGFEAFGDVLFKSNETRDNVRVVYTLVLAVLWLAVLVRTFVLMIRGLRENPHALVGGAAVILLLAAVLAADYFFKFHLFDFFYASQEAAQ